MVESTWLAHPLYEFYEVSSDGRIRSIDRMVEMPETRRTRAYRRFYPGVEIKDNVNPCNDYRMAVLHVNGRQINVTVHRMVCEAFHGLPSSPDLQVRHLNGIKTDCRAVNLTWGTRIENALDSQLHGTDWQLNKTHCPYGHEYTPANTYRQSGRRNARGCSTCVRRRHREKRERKKP